MGSGKRVGNRGGFFFLRLLGLFVSGRDLFFKPSFVFIFWRVGEGKEGGGVVLGEDEGSEEVLGWKWVFRVFFFKRWRELNYGHFLRVSVFPM